MTTWRVRVLAILICTIVIATVGGSVFQNPDDHSLRVIHTISSSPSNHTNRLHIGLVGDSWIANGRMDPFLCEAFSKVGIQITISSAGISGADSGSIRRKVLPRCIGSYSRNTAPMHVSIPIVIIVAGVNDFLEHRGPRSYASNVLLMAAALARENIIPVIIEIPRFGVRTEPNIKGIEHLKRRMRCKFLESDNSDQISIYRRTLRQSLRTLEGPRPVLINPDSVIPDYYLDPSLFSNPYHLNDNGYRELSRLITINIVDLVTNQSQHGESA